MRNLMRVTLIWSSKVSQNIFSTRLLVLMFDLCSEVEKEMRMRRKRD
uniref:Uncharacterized protein n=1 Tax=Nelumbo nucifera TaxID=4432 RepID=A0A822Z7P5_NELNU|nr:TPA_asm: hypothetical protein HUJ06_013329 [Nelumbo nucifera]